MMHRRLLLLVLLGRAGTLPAQPAVEMVSPPLPLPLRNVLIEVRQDDGQSEAREHLGADINARTQPGRTEAEIHIDAQDRQFERRGSAQQQVLVLNGRPAAIALGNSVPVRLYQIVTRNGVRRLIPGTLWLQPGTGFSATPLWEGGDLVYLELAATQGRQVPGPSASTTTTLMLPLGTWTTVAESDDSQDSRQDAQGLAGADRERRSGTTRLRVQVRVSIR